MIIISRTTRERICLFFLTVKFLNPHPTLIFTPIPSNPQKIHINSVKTWKAVGSKGHSVGNLYVPDQL